MKQILEEVLVHRCSHGGFVQLQGFLKTAAAAIPTVRLDFLSELQQLHKKPLDWHGFTGYHALVLIPDAPNSISFADAYATWICSRSLTTVPPETLIY